MTKWETKENPDIALKVREAQVAQLFKQSWVGLVGVLVVAIAICVALWQVLPSWKLVLWLGIFDADHFFTRLSYRYVSTKKPVGDEVNQWAKWHVIGTSASG